MLPYPLHPAIVHFPLVLAFLLPLIAAGAVWSIRRGTRPRRAWSIPVIATLMLLGSAWASVKTGEAQDERVERVVAEQPLSVHEEMAEGFLAGAGAVAFVAAVGLIGGLIGGIARVVTVVASLVLVLAAVRVGHSGGQLVYKYGAANAYVPAGNSSSASGAQESLARSGGRDDDDERR